jgi:hypothetical protein
MEPQLAAHGHTIDPKIVLLGRIQVDVRDDTAD